jgi:hypothetical protein
LKELAVGGTVANTTSLNPGNAGLVVADPAAKAAAAKLGAVVITLKFLLSETSDVSCQMND